MRSHGRQPTNYNGQKQTTSNQPKHQPINQQTTQPVINQPPKNTNQPNHQPRNQSINNHPPTNHQPLSQLGHIALDRPFRRSMTCRPLSARPAGRSAPDHDTQTNPRIKHTHNGKLTTNQQSPSNRQPTNKATTNQYPTNNQKTTTPTAYQQAIKHNTLINSMRPAIDVPKGPVAQKHTNQPKHQPRNQSTNNHPPTNHQQPWAHFPRSTFSAINRARPAGR